MTAKQHYDSLLGEVYAWMLGDFRQKVTEQKSFFEGCQLVPRGHGLAFDLGAGNGVQSVALSELGFRVKAVDFNKTLLDQLTSNKNQLPIEICQHDLLSFVQETKETPELVVCMGDTITHLPSQSELEALISRVASILPGQSKVIFSWRDLSREKFGTDRFIHVRSDETRSFTCFLEYLPDCTMVHDVITEKIGDAWTQKVSAYPKLRLSAEYVKYLFRQNQITVRTEQVIGGMIYLVGETS